MNCVNSNVYIEGLQSQHDMIQQVKEALNMRCHGTRCMQRQHTVNACSTAGSLAVSIISLSAALFAAWCAPAVQQVAFADKLLLNKIDLVSEAEKKSVINRVKVGVCSVRTNTEMVRCSVTVH